MRNVYYDTEGYPRYIGVKLLLLFGDCLGNDRGPGYAPKQGETPMIPIGKIPQVKHTYARFVGSF